MAIATTNSSALPLPQPLPVAGNYKSAPRSTHPFVFYDPEDYRGIAHSHAAVVKAALKHLEIISKFYLTKSRRYSNAYSGCDIQEYLYRLTFEQSGTGAAAAYVANTLATYAYLAKFGYGSPQLALRAGKLAHDILLTWAHNGFRKDGHFRSDFHDYCWPGKPNEVAWSDLPLQVARGVPNWVNAQDLLLAIGNLDNTEADTLNIFLKNEFELIRLSSNRRAVLQTMECGLFNNQSSVHVLGSLAIARLLRRDEWFEAAVLGHNKLLDVGWGMQLQENIYGKDEHARKCYQGDVDPHKYHETSFPSAGEIVDRYRAGLGQTFGYPMASLRALMMAATILRRSGFDAFAYRGASGQTILSALDYYSFYLKNFLTDHHSVVPDGPLPYPDYMQYSGKQIAAANGATITGADPVLFPYVIASVPYPGENSVRTVLSRAFVPSSNSVPLSGLDPLYLPFLVSVSHIIKPQAFPKLPP